MIQEKLIDEIRKRLANNEGLTDVIARVLDCSYDAAYRRIKRNAKFSIEETVLLAKYFEISLDNLYSIAETEKILVEKTTKITNEKELQKYFETSHDLLLPLLNKPNCSIYYSAKDIPLFYTLGKNTLSLFKMYAWLKLSDISFRYKSFEGFSPKLETLQAANKLGMLYDNIQVSEMWDVTSVNSTLKQIYYYYKASQISKETVVILCKELKEMFLKLIQKTSSSSSLYKMYYNELLLMNNNVLVLTPFQKSLFVPNAMLSYFVTNHEKTCEEAKVYFEKQFSSSKLLNTAGEKEQQLFYNKILEKINALEKLIITEPKLVFE